MQPQRSLSVDRAVPSSRRARCGRRDGPGSLVARSTLAAVAVLAALNPASIASAQASDENDTRWFTVAPGIEAALPSHAGRFDDGNSIRIATADGVILVDPPTDPAVTEGWIERSRTDGRAVRLILSTHWHSDHHQTASRVLDAFPQAQFLGHRLLQTQIASQVEPEHRDRVQRLETQIPAAKAALAEGRGLSGNELSDDQLEAQRAAIARAEAWLDNNTEVRFTVPTVGLGGPTTLRMGDVQVDVHVFRAHTDGDLVLLLPAQGVALTGDLLDDLPFVGHGAPRSWIATLDLIDHWPVNTFVPGHGAPFGKEQIRRVRAFLEDLVDLVDQARAAGEDLETFLARAVDDARFELHRGALAPDDAARRFFDGTLEAALRATWREVE